MRKLSILCVLVFVGAVHAEEVKKERVPIYSEEGDGAEQVAAALARAQLSHKNVLIQWGANWCGWCYMLHDVFENEEAVSALLDSSYEVVMINTDHNKDYVAELGTEIRGVPFLTVLDASGKKLADQDTGSLEIGPKHDVPKVVAFLEKLEPAVPSAQDALDAALKQAGEEGKAVLMTFGARWCGWCRQFERYLLKPEVWALLNKAYVPLKIDMARMEGAEAVAAAYEADKSGIPWFAMLDADGKPLVTSMSDGGNIGYPLEPEGAAWFAEMLKKTAKGLTEAELARLGALLEEQNLALRARRK